MIGEARAASTAKKLEGILLSILEEADEELHAVLNLFATEKLVEWYYDECCESYGMHNPNQEIIKKFPPKGK